MNDLIIVSDGSVPEADAPLYKTLTLSEAIEIAPGITIPAGTKLTGRLDYLFPALNNNPTPNNKANLLADITALLYGLSGAAATVNNALYNVARAVYTAGYYTGDGVDGRTISVGFHPQTVLIMRSVAASSTIVNTHALVLRERPWSTVQIVPTGFRIENSLGFNVNGEAYPYIAFR